MPPEITSFFYLAALFVSGGCMLMVDLRFRLFVFKAPWRAALVLLIGTVFFLTWDLAGISLGIFLHGPGPYMTGVMLGPELPLEELFFLIFLCHLTMVLITGAQRVLSQWDTA